MQDQTTNTQNNNWYDDYTNEENDDFQIEEYELTATPNDFNISTIYNFIESGAVKIPGFQRTYVWDIIRASKLIESLILGLPVPQIFLYEESRNSFLVIDGQQRLMSIYYFIKQRFPLKEKRVELRSIFNNYGRIPDEILFDDNYFTSFSLNLQERVPDHPNKFRNLKYATLGDHKTQFELRPIRNVIIKQNVPSDDDSSIYEIFNRLNSGGINLSPQEIRTSLHHSKFYDMLFELNMLPNWRKILSASSPDIHGKDIEILLRGFAMLINGHKYKPSLTKFLNQFSQECKNKPQDINNYLKELFISFLNSCVNLSPDAFINKKNGRFNIALFEAIFVVSCERAFLSHTLIDQTISSENILKVEQNQEFGRASLENTTSTSNVKKRLDTAKNIFSSP